MRVLLVGKGAREHAFARKIAGSPLTSAFWIWPGNPVMATLGTVVDLPAPDALAKRAGPGEPFAALKTWAKAARPDLVVVGPEAPLADGMADALESIGVPVFGPVQAAARLESSKTFSKEVMAAAGIPTAACHAVKGEAETRAAALSMLDRTGGTVIKASGLAAGKGVFVCTTAQEVSDALARLFQTEMSSAAEGGVVVEEVLQGRECSYFTFLGAATGPIGLGFAVDHKRLKDGDVGPNTGGMGCYAPVPWLPEGAEARVVKEVVQPLLAELTRRGISYRGCLYVGLMWHPTKGPQVVEFNVRFGDPEAQVLAVHDERDWLALMAAAAGVALPKATVSAPERAKGAAVAVVMADGTYPYGEGKDEAATVTDRWLTEANGVCVFVAAAKNGANGAVITGTGRVLTVAAHGGTITEARRAAYERVEMIAAAWPTAQYRTDIGQIGLEARS